MRQTGIATGLAVLLTGLSSARGEVVADLMDQSGLGTSVQAARGSPGLLATYQFRTTGGAAPVADPRVELLLQILPYFPPDEFAGLGADLGIFWEDGAQGAFDFRSSTDSEFDDFAAFAEDGINDMYLFQTLFPTGGGPGQTGVETELFGGSSDLIGYELDSARLIVTETHITPWTPDPEHEPGITGFRFDVQGRYEFYGSPVPEPSVLGLMAMGVVIVAWRQGRC